MAAASRPASKSKSRAKGPKLSRRDIIVRRGLSWLALGLWIVGIASLAVALVAYGVGIFISNPITALTLEIMDIWYLAHNFSLDLFQVLIERKLIFWLPNPTDPWFNVVRPVLFQMPVTVAAFGGVLLGLGWGIGRIVRVP